MFSGEETKSGEGHITAASFCAIFFLLFFFYCMRNTVGLGLDKSESDRTFVNPPPPLPPQKKNKNKLTNKKPTIIQKIM